jgi:hypothetical protein
MNNYSHDVWRIAMRGTVLDSIDIFKTMSRIAVLPLLGLMTTAAIAQLPVPANGIISQPGQYYLLSNLLVSRDTGIRIDANNVTLDLAGHALRYFGTPHVGTFGIVTNGRTNVRITNGSVGGFWFNVHASQNNSLQIDNVSFDDIPYIGVNAADSHGVVIQDNNFTNFRYDIPKSVDPYVIGINIGAENAVITRNNFDAVYTGPDPNVMSVETVLVLFSANVSQRSIVTRNVMAANVPLNRSYGLWVASNAHVTAMHNTIQNMRYGVTLASNATSLVSYNEVSVGPPPAGLPPLSSTFGIFANAAEQIFETGNVYQGQTHPTFLPPNASVDWDNTNMVLPLAISNLAASLLPGVGYDRIEFPGAFTHGGSLVIDVSTFERGPISELKLIGWIGEVGNAASTAVSFTGGPALPYEFRNDGFFVDVGETLVGDYNGDDAVDAADYVIWRKIYGTHDLYSLWHAEFGGAPINSGFISSATAATKATVPEPTAGHFWIYMAIIALLGSTQARSSQRS